MNERLAKILASNANLDDYIDEYSNNDEFLYQYFSRDITRVLGNKYIYYGDNLSVSNQVKLAELAISNDINYDILNRIFHTFLNMGMPDEAKPLLDKVLNLIKEGKIDVNKLNDNLKYLFYRDNPLQAIEMDINNIKYISNVNKEEFKYIIDRLEKANYLFSRDNMVFIEDNVYNDYDNFLYFVNNAQFSASIGYEIETRIKKFSVKELHNFYKNCHNEYYRGIVFDMLNQDNYDINSIIPGEKIYLTYNNNYDQIIEYLKKLKNNNFNNDVIIQMLRVDMKLVEEAYSIIGNNLKVSPVVNQNRYKNENLDKIDKKLPAYDIDSVRKSERVLNMYASMVNDTVDRDGDIKSLSPLEKYAAAYLMVTKFAVYKKEGVRDSQDISRAVYEIVNQETNTKIVCAGYANLLLEILYRMGIDSTTYWSVVGERKGSIYDDHARILIHLTDPKYNIDGVYMADPTWDSKTLTETRYTHMLMSHDELLKVDSDLSLEALHADDYIKMDQKLGIDNSHELFYKPIPKDVIVKAYLALDRYLGRNTKMAKDNDYSLLEYSSKAAKLGFESLNREHGQELFNQIMPMTRNELASDYRELVNGFKFDLTDYINEYLKNSGVGIKIDISVDDNDLLDNMYTKISLDDPLIDEYKKYYDVKEIKRRNIGLVTLYEFNDKKIAEQYNDMIDAINNFNSFVDNLSSNNEDNKLK